MQVKELEEKIDEARKAILKSVAVMLFVETVVLLGAVYAIFWFLIKKP